MKNDFFGEIFEINRRLFADLWNLVDVSQTEIAGLTPKLVIPQKRDKTNRISEQEARFLYVRILNSMNFFYSVETPTQQTYMQKGLSARSAASDLSLYKYRNSKFDKILNIEFKAHNPKQESIYKDIEKLLLEKTAGCWIHLLKNVDSGTIPSLFDKFVESLKTLIPNQNHSQTILFAICILDKEVGIQKLLKFDKKTTEHKLAESFRLDYHIKNGQIIFDDQNGWEIYYP